MTSPLTWICYSVLWVPSPAFGIQPPYLPLGHLSLCSLPHSLCGCDCCSPWWNNHLFFFCLICVIVTSFNKKCSIFKNLKNLCSAIQMPMNDGKIWSLGSVLNNAWTPIKMLKEYNHLKEIAEMWYQYIYLEYLKD